MRRATILAALLALAAAAPAAAANDQQFLSIYGGWSRNDDDSQLDDGEIYGLRYGGESPAAGGQITLGLNRDGHFKMDTLLFSVLFNFYSRDARTPRGRIIFNRFSSFFTAGIGVMRFEDEFIDDADLYFAYELGVGLQYKFTSAFGLRLQANGIRTGARSLTNLESTLGVAFHW